MDKKTERKFRDPEYINQVKSEANEVIQVKTANDIPLFNLARIIANAMVKEYGWYSYVGENSQKVFLQAV